MQFSQVFTGAALTFMPTEQIPSRTKNPTGAGGRWR